MRNYSQIFNHFLPRKSGRKKQGFAQGTGFLAFLLPQPYLVGVARSRTHYRPLVLLPTPIDQGPAPVPEPVTALLFGAALLIGGAIARRRRNNGHK